VIARLLKHGKPASLQVITRFDLEGFARGVSDTAALRMLMQSGAQIRGIRNLHSKLYLFGMSHAIVTSANLTEAGLQRNQEFGFVATDIEIVNQCQRYFDGLWERAGQDLTKDRLEGWELTIQNHLATGARPSVTAGLEDDGMDVGFLAEPITLPPFVSSAEQAFVKFFGQSRDREDRSTSVIDEVDRSGCHWACTYPRNKRPRAVRDGAVMFMGRLVRDSNDILIYGRAIGCRYHEGDDDATTEDIKRRPWKETWPHYVRVHNAEFLAGTLADCISLGELMDELGADSFASTAHNAARGKGNTDPRRAYMQQAAVELSARGAAWLNERFERACAERGKLAPVEIEKLDWPAVPVKG
jgi:hypothetical protein